MGGVRLQQVAVCGGLTAVQYWPKVIDKFSNYLKNLCSLLWDICPEKVNCGFAHVQVFPNFNPIEAMFFLSTVTSKVHHL